MLNETASSRENRPAARLILPEIPSIPDDLRNLVADVLDIKREVTLDTKPEAAASQTFFMGNPGTLVATFQGDLRLDSEAAYAQLDAALKPRNLLPIFRMAQPDGDAMLGSSGQHTVHVIRGRANPRRRPWWPNLVLFIITIFSVLWVGTMLDVQMMGAFHAQQILNNLPFELWRGIPYAASILLILGSHELGHYFAARRHNLAVTLPYFIPVPPLVSLFGTLGAFIQLREPMRNRKVLLDVGMAGPLAGLVFAVPILFIGLANMTPQPVTSLGGIYEGDSILYAAAKTLTYGHFVPDGRTDICITCNQLAWAGWTGLLVTALNLMPIGQLDGGHILYALIGERARKLYYPLLGVMIGLVLVTRIWMLWVLLLLLFGRIYATPLDMITPLDKRRRWLAIFSLVVFILVFVPTPLTEIAAPAASPPPSGNSVYQLPFNPFS